MAATPALLSAAGIGSVRHAALDLMIKHAAADQALASLHTASVAKLSELFLGFVASKVGGLYVEVVSFP